MRATIEPDIRPGAWPMKVVQFDDVPLVRGLEHRGGTFHSRTTAEGRPGTPANFKFSISELGTDYSGPRHRHNFDQYRFMLEANPITARTGRSRPACSAITPRACRMGRR